MRTAIRNQKISLQKGIKSPNRMAALLVVLAMLLSLLLSGSLSFAEIEEGGTIPDSQKYTVTFVDEDGVTVLGQATEYEAGTSAGSIIQPATPTKPSDGQYTYTFGGWDPHLSDVTNHAVYRATYYGELIVASEPAGDSPQNPSKPLRPKSQRQSSRYTHFCPCRHTNIWRSFFF